ncbi:MAG: hypothetical protein QOF82_832, partial [Frankiales bacterium]|nr:hypothetical protein [Frankiales bacterium]
MPRSEPVDESRLSLLSLLRDGELTIEG